MLKSILPCDAKVFPIFVAIMVWVSISGNPTIGNQVRILDSTRCCNLLIFSGNTQPLYRFIGMGRPPEREKVRRPAIM
jgi:hypothetical protein